MSAAWIFIFLVFVFSASSSQNQWKDPKEIIFGLLVVKEYVMQTKHTSTSFAAGYSPGMEQTHEAGCLTEILVHGGYAIPLLHV